MKGLAFILYLIYLLSFINSIPSKHKNRGNTISDNTVNIEGFTKECSEFRSCMQCTFEEMKTEEKCFDTGAYLIKQCQYYDDQNILKQEAHIKEKCQTNDNFYFLTKITIILLIVGCGSFILRKRQKERILGNVFHRITPGKYK